MARPCRKRRIQSFPDYWAFSAQGSESERAEILMSLDEYETIRLIDLEGKSQEECAAQMEVARTTVTAIYESARKKLSKLLVEGNSLRIAGGAYRLSSDNQMTEIEKKGKSEMRIAVTYENGLVGQHFGRTEEFKLYDAENGTIMREQVISTNGKGHGMLAGVLLEAEVNVLICGGIGMGARNALQEAGIELLPGVSGEADEVIKMYLEGTLEADPDAHCDHHDHHHEEGHECHHGHGCGEHACS